VTSPPEGRDGTSPSVAALAVHVNGLHRDIETLTGKVDALTSTQRQHAALLNGLAELRSQIDQILTILASQDDDAPAAWFWLTMPDQERDEKLSELADWVETVLRTQYPDYLADQVRPCWPNHPEARWQLAWLYQQWSQAYLAEQPALKDAADWHDRWSPGVIRRLSVIMRRCEEGCRRLPRDGRGSTAEAELLRHRG
jgi:hypothetical protein